MSISANILKYKFLTLRNVQFVLIWERPLKVQLGVFCLWIQMNKHHGFQKRRCVESLRKVFRNRGTGEVCVHHPILKTWASCTVLGFVEMTWAMLLCKSVWQDTWDEVRMPLLIRSSAGQKKTGYLDFKKPLHFYREGVCQCQIMEEKILNDGDIAKLQINN